MKRTCKLKWLTFRIVPKEVLDVLIRHEKMEECLQFYADKKNYGCTGCFPTNLKKFYPIIQDAGAKATRCLAEIKLDENSISLLDK